MRNSSITINKHQITVKECGSGRTAIFFIHGISSSSKCFAPQMESPLDDKYRMVAIDLPGHGDSAPSDEPETTYTIPAYADMVVSVAKEMEIEDAVFVGYSMGGNMLLEAAPRLRRARGMVILGTAPLGIPLDIQKMAYPHPELDLLFRKDLSEDEMDVWIEGVLSHGAEYPADDILADLRRADGKARECLGKSIMEGRYADEVELVGKLNIPLAIFLGKEEQLIRKAYVEGLSIPSLWREKVHAIPGAGHAAQLERPEEFNALLESFIEELPPGTG